MWVQGWTTGVNGTQLWDMLQSSFAWVSTTGYTSKANVTTQFPVVVGEFGSSFADLMVRLTLHRLTSCQIQAPCLVLQHFL